MADRLFLIWSIEHDAWWGPNRIGYTRALAEAGRYWEPEARDIVTRANYPPGTCHECAIPLACLFEISRDED
jgi:hypothetical protein